jgi:hypothetical protein
VWLIGLQQGQGYRDGHGSICIEISVHVLRPGAFILFLGVSAITVMPMDIFPEINIPVVSVISTYLLLKGNAQGGKS